MRHLYERTELEFPPDLALDKVQKDISTWHVESLFSLSVMCDRNSVSKRSCRRSVYELLELGLLKKRGW